MNRPPFMGRMIINLRARRKQYFDAGHGFVEGVRDHIGGAIGAALGIMNTWNFDVAVTGADGSRRGPYVVRLSSAPAPAAARRRIQRTPIAIMPRPCCTGAEWLERYGSLNTPTATSGSHDNGRIYGL